jgi:hypothetical protein
MFQTSWLKFKPIDVMPLNMVPLAQSLTVILDDSNVVSKFMAEDKGHAAWARVII